MRIALKKDHLISIFLFLIIPAGFIFAERGEELFWIKYDPETKKMELSNGQSVPSSAIPGQFYEREYGGLEREKQWRSPLDIIYDYKGGSEGRVVFSHERHFSLLGEKSCSKCHDDSVGLGDKGIVRESHAKQPNLEAHGEKSTGRFCATCHNGKTTAGSLSKNLPAGIPTSTPVFDANKTGQSQDCNRCHTPRDHGSDYTNFHGEDAEHGRGSNCLTCHRGADRITSAQQNQAIAFRDAQLQLINDPENETLFKKTLPPVFCAYCHNSDGKAWEKRSRSDRSRSERYEDREDEEHERREHRR